MESSPTYILGFPAILAIMFFAFIVWRIINHRNGLALVICGCGLVLGIGAFVYLMLPHRVVTQVAQEVPVPTRQAEISTTIPLAISEATAAVSLKPAWVIDETTRDANGTDIFSVTVGPQATLELCERDLASALRKRVDEYVDNFIGEPGAGRRVQLEMADIRSRLVKEQHVEPYEATFADMKILHARVEIDRAAQDMIRQRYQEALVQARLGYAGGAFGLLLVLLGTAFGYLKLDTATKGYYSGRLKLAATAVILTAAAATALVVRQADPAAEWPVGFPVRESPQLVDF